MAAVDGLSVAELWLTPRYCGFSFCSVMNTNWYKPKLYAEKGGKDTAWKASKVSLNDNKLLTVELGEDGLRWIISRSLSHLFLVLANWAALSRTFDPCFVMMELRKASPLIQFIEKDIS